MSSDEASPELPTRRHDPPASQEQTAPHAHAQLLASGELLLRQLSQEALAARAEAKKAELERLLERAHSGDCGPLITWLTAHEHEVANRPQASCQQAPPPVQTVRHTSGDKRERDSIRGEEVPTGGQDTNACQPLTSWEPIRVAARRRLAARDRSAASADRALPIQRTHRGEKPVIRAPHLSRQDSRTITTSPPAKPTRKVRETPANPNRSGATQAASKKSRATANHRVAPRPTSNKRTGSPQSTSQPASKQVHSRLRGMIASALAHLLLLVALGLITLRAPQEPAGLSLSSSQTSAAEETFELSQPIDVETPIQQQTIQDYQPQMDFAEEVLRNAAAAEAFAPTAPTADRLTDALADAAQATHATAASSQASFFGAASGGNCFCYVIDFSGSMRGGPWEAARSELLKSLSSLSPKQRFYIILFHQELLSIPTPGSQDAAPFPLYATPDNLQHAKRWLLSLQVGRSGREPSEAITEAISKEPDAIYLLTDGVTAVKDVPERIRIANRTQDSIFGEQILTTIHTIAYYSLEGRQLLQQIAAENQGQFIYVPDPSK